MAYVKDDPFPTIVTGKLLRHMSNLICSRHLCVTKGVIEKIKTFFPSKAISAAMLAIACSDIPMFKY